MSCEPELLFLIVLKFWKQPKYVMAQGITESKLIYRMYIRILYH